jgi:hypothetical protein
MAGMEGVPMAGDDALTVLWQLESRLTDSATAMEKEAGTKQLSGPAAERLANRADGMKLARAYVWDAIRELHNGTETNGNGSS